jgi:hypothetical protein
MAARARRLAAALLDERGRADIERYATEQDRRAEELEAAVSAALSGR